MNTCINHTTRQATARCKRCGRPICNDCKMVSEVGVVCSEQCLDAIKTFQDRVGEDVPHKARRPILGRGFVKVVLGIGILFGIAYAILCLQEGRLLSPADLSDQMQSWLWLIQDMFS